MIAQIHNAVNARIQLQETFTASQLEQIHNDTTEDMVTGGVSC